MCAKRRHELTEVILGDIIDPATFRMVFKSDMAKIYPMEKAISKISADTLHPSYLKPGRIVAVFSEKDNLWFRGRIIQSYTVYGGESAIDVLLLDHGMTMTGVKSNQVRQLPEMFVNIEPFCFTFKLNGLIPVTRTYKLRSSTNHSFPLIKGKMWADICSTVAHITSRTNKKASIRIESRDSHGLPKSGKLIMELDPNKLDLYQPYIKFLANGGYCEQLPVVDLNEAYVGSKFAVFVEPDSQVPECQLLPSFYQAKVKKPKRLKPLSNSSFIESPSTPSGPPSTRLDDDPLSNAIRRMKICQELDEFI